MKFLILLLSLSFCSFSQAQDACEASLTAAQYTDALSRVFSGENVYKPVLSTDTSYIETIARIDREKTFPQKNMRKAEKSHRYWVDADYEAHNLYRRAIYQADAQRVYGHMRNKKKVVHTAGQEILEDLLETLPNKYPERFWSKGKKLYDKISKEVWDLSSTQLDPLVLAGHILGEDLILLEQMANGQFRMVGGFLASPSSWSLERHLGNTLRKIHADEGERLAKMIEAAVTNIKRKDMTSLRNGWQFTRYPHYGQFPYIEQTEQETTGRITRANIHKNVHLRSEMQTISLLPKSDLMLFTIKVFQYDLDTVATNPEMANSLINGVKMNIEQDHYDFPHPRLIIEYLQQRAEQ